MSRIVGIDLSSRALDLVALEEDSNRADWVRCELHGKDAWERTLRVRDELWGSWENVHLVAIEAPYGRGQAGTQAVLNRVVGAVAASLPAHLRSSERCWIVRPDEYRTALKMRHNKKPDWLDVCRAFDCDPPYAASSWDQNAWDALCLSAWARRELHRAIEAA